MGDRSGFRRRPIDRRRYFPFVRHTLRIHTVTVGHSDLEHAEFDVRRAWGAFRPGLGYELVQPVFRLFAQAVSRDGITLDPDLLERYYRARDQLHLELVDADGNPIKTSAIHIVDYSTADGKPDGVELDVLISDDTYWNRRRKENAAPP